MQSCSLQAHPNEYLKTFLRYIWINVLVINYEYQMKWFKLKGSAIQSEGAMWEAGVSTRFYIDKTRQALSVISFPTAQTTDSVKTDHDNNMTYYISNTFWY